MNDPAIRMLSDLTRGLLEIKQELASLVASNERRNRLLKRELDAQQEHRRRVESILQSMTFESGDDWWQNGSDPPWEGC